MCIFTKLNCVNTQFPKSTRLLFFPHENRGDLLRSVTRTLNSCISSEQLTGAAYCFKSEAVLIKKRVLHSTKVNTGRYISIYEIKETWES